jgi:hypothetical protein
MMRAGRVLERSGGEQDFHEKRIKKNGLCATTEAD